MKGILAIIFGIIFSMSLSYGQYRDKDAYQSLYDSETVAAMKAHVRELSAISLEGRKAGSDGEKVAAEYVQSGFEKYGVDVLTPEGGEIFGLKAECHRVRSRI